MWNDRAATSNPGSFSSQLSGVSNLIAAKWLSEIFINVYTNICMWIHLLTRSECVFFHVLHFALMLKLSLTFGSAVTILHTLIYLCRWAPMFDPT